MPHFDRARIAMLEQALIVCDKLLEGQKDNPRLHLMQAVTLQRSGTILSALARNKEAEERFDRALSIIQAHGARPVAPIPGESFAKIEVITRQDRGRMFIRVGQPDRARDDFEASLRKLDSLVDGSTDPDLMYLRATVNSNLAIIAMDTKDLSAAKLYLGRARQLLEDLFRDVSRDVVYVAAYVIVLNTLGVANLDDNEVDRASELFKEAVDFSAPPGQAPRQSRLSRRAAPRPGQLRHDAPHEGLPEAAEPLAEASRSAKNWPAITRTFFPIRSSYVLVLFPDRPGSMMHAATSAPRTTGSPRPSTG